MTLKEQYVKQAGWEKVKGWKVDTECVDDEYSFYYFDEEEAKDIIYKVSFWRSKEDDEHVFESIDELIEYIEDNQFLSFESFKNFEISEKKRGKR